jgi:ribosomal protein S18 acetylase RimI-like enzyme
MRHLIEQIINQMITYESGDPSQYRDQFSKMWIEHMNYLESIANIKYGTNFNNSVFQESLSNFRRKHSEIKLFVAKENYDVVGFLQAGIAPNRKIGFISDLHVLEDYRGQHIGEELMRNCFSWFSKNNLEQCELEVIGGNEKVLEFYKQYGFETRLYTLNRNLK